MRTDNETQPVFPHQIEPRYGLAMSSLAIDNYEQRAGRNVNVELRGILTAWINHWTLYEFGAASQVRAGWIYHNNDELYAGQLSRIARLSPRVYLCFLYFFEKRYDSRYHRHFL